MFTCSPTAGFSLSFLVLGVVWELSGLLSSSSSSLPRFEPARNHRKQRHRDQESVPPQFQNVKLNVTATYPGGGTLRHRGHHCSLTDDAECARRIQRIPGLSPVNMLVRVCKAAGLMLVRRANVLLTDQRGRRGRSLGFHAGARVLLTGCLLLGGLDERRGLAAGRLSERCGRRHQIGGG